MDRRNTIIIAALVNAALLVLLFIFFLYREEEDKTQHSLNHPLVFNENRPLFQEPALFEQIPPEPVPLAALPPPAVEHKLPPLVAVQEQELPVSASLPSPLPMPPPQTASSLLEIQVKKGDTLEKLAKAHHTTVDEIIRLNQLPSSFLRIGQSLKMPKERSAPRATAVAPALRQEESLPEYYTVKVGDNPWTIAMKHHMKVDELLKLNDLNEERARRLKVGDKLRIR